MFCLQIHILPRPNFELLIARRTLRRLFHESETMTIRTSSVENRLRNLSSGACRIAAFAAVVLIGLLATDLSAQEESNNVGRANPAPWRPSFGPLENKGLENESALPARTTTSSSLPNPNPNVTNPLAASQTKAQAQSAIQPNTSQQRGLGQDVRSATITKVTKTMNRLPNDAGQIWREYDISPYTSRITSIDKPQQAILDWILRETGTEMWFNEPFGIMNADRNQLRVYHTPEIQRVVHRIVDRFVNTRGQVQDLSVGLVTVSKPTWRESAYSMLQPIEVSSAGVEAWMINKENAAILMARLRQRPDFKEHGTGSISHHDGQTVSLKKTQPVQFVRNLRWVPGSVPNYQPLMTTIDEGYLLEISSLSSVDGKTIDASIKASVDQVEKLNTIKIDAQGIGGAVDKVNLQIPELVSWRLEERFRWTNDQVLLLSCGVVASPTPKTTRSNNRLPGIFSGRSRDRADALMFIEYRGPQLPQNMPAVLGQRNSGVTNR